MPRRTKEDAAATREELLDAAEACFLQSGVFRATLDDIAARAGYTKGAVYWHFKNKYEMFEAVMERVELPVYTEIERLDADAGEWPLRALRVFFRRGLERFGRDIHCRNAVEIHLLHCELVPETMPTFDRMHRATTASYARELEAFQRARQLGHLRAGLDPQACARTLHFALHGALREWVLNPSEVKIEVEGIAALETVLRSFAVDPSVVEDSKSAV
jgi:TetR/AcrR family acrAB operon transcriptional repressor